MSSIDIEREKTQQFTDIIFEFIFNWIELNDEKREKKNIYRERGRILQTMIDCSSNIND